MNKEEFNKLYETLKNSRFKQQKFPGWRPLPTISCITITLIVMVLMLLKLPNQINCRFMEILLEVIKA